MWLVKQLQSGLEPLHQVQLLTVRVNAIKVVSVKFFIVCSGSCASDSQ